MNEMNQVQDEELDLFELLRTLWDGKWLISAFVATAVLLGGGFLLLKDAVYESKLRYTVDTIPPFYDQNRVLTDFQRLFYSVSVFENWKQKNINTTLVFDDFNRTEMVEGFVLTKNADEQLATLASEKKYGSFLLVRSNQLHVLDDFFKYANHIRASQSDDYIARAEEELKIIEARFKSLGKLDSNIVDTVLSIDRYIASVKRGASALAIQRPTMPKKVLKSSLVLAMSLALGGMLGVFVVLFRNVTAKRKEQLAQA